MDMGLDTKLIVESVKLKLKLSPNSILEDMDWDMEDMVMGTMVLDMAIPTGDKTCNMQYYTKKMTLDMEYILNTYSIYYQQDKTA
jgi:hypothetical protein